MVTQMTGYNANYIEKNATGKGYGPLKSRFENHDKIKVKVSVQSNIKN